MKNKTFKFLLLAVIVLTALLHTEKTYAQKVLIGPRLSGNLNIYNQKGLTGTWNGIGAAIGGTIDVSFSPHIGLMANLNVFDMRNFKNSQTQGGVTTEQSYKLAYVTPEVLFKTEFSGFYMVAGPSLGINITNSGEITQTATGQTPVSQTSNPEVNTMRLDIKTGAGYTFSLGNNMYMGTDFMVMIPVTDTYNFTGVSNSVLTFQLGAALKFKI
ncbi:MAG: outer membrane beta-barrel protein [Ignavibacteriae bacterium]|nr:outer membrane beta-barrel protein [Ignavibacteriota bacterium]MCB9242575.1 outer membrane beta-barrel protein [Ignavibacteriales bacterium]